MKDLQLRTKLIIGISFAFIIIIISLIVIRFYLIRNLNGILEQYVIPEDIVNKIFNKQVISILVILIFGLIYAIFIITYLTSPFSKQLKRISAAVNKLRIKEFDIKIPSFDKKELKNLGAVFDSMCSHIKDTNEAIEKSREKYKNLVNNLHEEYIFFSKDPTGKLLYVSPSVKDILGYPVNEFMQLKDSIYTSNPINEKAKEHESKSLKGKAQPYYQIEIYSKSGIPHIFEISELPIYNKNKLTSVEGMARDITKGKKAEDLIKEKEEKYKLLFNKASDFIFLYEIKDDFKPGKFLEVNDYTTKKLGYSQEELREMSPVDLTAVDFGDDTSKEDQLAKNSKFERIWEAKDGTLFNVEIRSHKFKIQNKDVAIAIARDITERKQVEEEIRYVNEELINQKENLEALIDNLTQTQEQLVQAEKMAALGQLIAGIAHEINTPLGAIKASIGNLNDSLDKALNELPTFVTNSTTKDLKIFIKILNLANNEIPNIPSREKRKYRKEIVEELIAENINSPDIIADILIYLHIFDNYHEIVKFLKDEKTLEILKIARDFASIQKNTFTILLAVEKATKVVFALKKYVHRSVVGEKVPTDIIDGIETVLTLYQNQLKHGIEVMKKYDKLPSVSCDQDEMNQVWTNLIHNAIQAMNNKGILKITVLNKDDIVTISIADNGCGIEPDVHDKVFEPFFTTKKQGEGSGLGLDIVKKIIDKHNGKIAFQSELGKGTEFTVELPVK